MPEPRAEAEALLFREAALLDEGDFDGWLELFAEDATYWIPSGSDDLDPSREVSIVYDRLPQLRERVWRLQSGMAYAQEPRSRTSHLVGNIVVEADEPRLQVRSAFLVSEFRRDRQYSHAGRYRHELRRTDAGLAIVLKKVELINNDGALGNLSVLL